MYLNTSNGNVYQYEPVDDGLQWTLKGNLRGAKGDGGLGVPAGGTTGQILTKVSDADNDTSWQDLKGGRSVDITQYRQNNKFIFPVNIINECVKEFLNGCSVVFVDKNDEDKPTSYKMISATQDGSGYENIYIFTLETYSKKGEVPVVAKSVYFPSEETYHIDAIADLSGGGLDGASFLGNGMTRICVYDDRTIAEEAQIASYDGQFRKIDETYYVKPKSGIPKTDLSAEVQAKLNAGGGAENLLKSEVTFAEVGGGIGVSILDYALNLEVGKAYKLKWDISGEQYSQTTYCWLRNEQIQLGTADSGGGGEFILLIPNDPESGVMWIVDKYYANPATEETAPSENNASIVVTGYASTLKLISIEDAPSGGGSTMYAHHLRISDYGFATGTEQVNIAATIINTSANAITFDTLKAYLETLDNGYSKRLMVSGCAHDGTGVTAIVYGLMLSSNNIIAIYNAMTSTQVEQSVQLNNSAMVDDTVVQIC